MLFLLVGVFSNFSYGQDKFFRTGENLAYSADTSINHVWTMVQPDEFDDITITVSLNKVSFRKLASNPQENFGWNTGNAIPAGWNLEIISAEDQDQNSLTFDQNNKTFTFTGDPEEIITVKVKIKDNNGDYIEDANGDLEVSITYFLVAPLTTDDTFNNCLQARVFTVEPISQGGTVLCAPYSFIAKDAAGVVKFSSIDQQSNIFNVIGLPFNANYTFTVSDSCGNTLDGVFSVPSPKQLGTTVVFSGKQCAADTKGIAVLRISGATKTLGGVNLTWKLEKIDGAGNPTQIMTDADTGKYDKDGDAAADTKANYTLTIGDLDLGDYKFTFTDAAGCTKEREFKVIEAPSIL